MGAEIKAQESNTAGTPGHLGMMGPALPQPAQSFLARKGEPAPAPSGPPGLLRAYLEDTQASLNISEWALSGSSNRWAGQGRLLLSFPAAHFLPPLWVLARQQIELGEARRQGGCMGGQRARDTKEPG